MALNAAARPDPERLLQRVLAEEAYERQGRLKVFLGYASGVGKSFRMMDEGRRRHERGQDVVIGALQPEIPSGLAPLVSQFEVMPLLIRGGVPVIDLDRILNRHPGVCLVDGLAYDNPPSSRNAHRWQDVEELLQAGISVLTTINVQYVDERREQVEAIRGKRVNVTVPESFLRRADEIVVVDVPAEDCAERGSLLPGQQHKLSQLREIALLLAADVVDGQLESQRELAGLVTPWGTQERILVCVTPRTNAVRMIERARLIRDRFHGELFVIYVGQPLLNSDDQIALERNLSVARAAGAEIKLLQGKDAVQTIIDFARENDITQIFIGHSLDTDWRSRFRAGTVDRLIAAAEGMDVKLFPH
jgi:two-component system, OmpR family, sensor histidine kinase KdpD